MVKQNRKHTFSQCVWCKPCEVISSTFCESFTYRVLVRVWFVEVAPSSCSHCLCGKTARLKSEGFYYWYSLIKPIQMDRKVQKQAVMSTANLLCDNAGTRWSDSSYSWHSCMTAGLPTEPTISTQTMCADSHHTEINIKKNMQQVPHLQRWDTYI